MEKESTIKSTIYILIVLVILASFSVLLFTQFNFTAVMDGKYGPLGDTIGGLTAPVINIGAALLVYLSFKTQTRANEIQRKALEEEVGRANNIKELELLRYFVDETVGQIKALRLIDPAGIHGATYGTGAFELFYQQVNQRLENSKGIIDMQYWEDFCNWSILCERTVRLIHTSKISQAEKELLLYMISYQITSKIGGRLNNMIIEIRSQNGQFTKEGMWEIRVLDNYLQKHLKPTLLLLDQYLDNLHPGTRMFFMNDPDYN